ncbi:hypothetical protein B0A52_00518 [Exophiala mesophila]|uniref:Zn(2)-C6 fungal-type domain-containing protein n=1 Tax=Exophiala mesophila TaxID=212818 RepID=A0A438NHG1_EXOME|nr:hypothetical protein B0A52_00518 [Exophiala mesophila]
MARRQAFACSRCFRRKKRCDAKFPACSNCQAAGVECVSIDRESENDVPRSLVKFLEQSIAELEIEISTRNGNKSVNPETGVAFAIVAEGPSSTHIGLPRPEKSAEHAMAVLSNVTADAQSLLCGTDVIRNSEELPYLNVMLHEAHLPTPLWRPKAGDERQMSIPPRKGLKNFVPVSVARTLLDAYIYKILPQYPIFLVNDLEDLFNSVYDPVDNPNVPATHYYIMSLIMAITTMTSKSDDIYRPLALAESLHTEARAHASALGTTSIQSLQCLLLSIQLSFLLPHTGDLVHLANEAMRLATELGLHQERTVPPEMPSCIIQFRRALFWSCYTLDRSINLVGHRCFAIRDENISIQFPEPPSCAGSSDINGKSPETLDYLRFINGIRHRQIQSEICAVQFCNKKFLQPSYSDWREDMGQKVLNWRTQAMYDSQVMPYWIDLATWYNVFTLHRPCLPNPSPDVASINTCFTAAENLTASYWESCREGRSRFPWHTIHNCFEIGIVLLYNIRNQSTSFTETLPNGITSALDVLNKISNIFCVLADRWPAAWQCGEFFDKVKKESLRSFFSVSGTSKSSNLSTNLAVIDDMVLHRPGDTQYVPAFGGLSEFDFGREMANLENWRNISQPIENIEIQNLDSVEFSTFDLEFDDVDWSQFVSLSAYSSLETFPTLDVEPVLAQVETPSKLTFDLSSTERYLEIAFKNLPPCRYCRKRRTRCDRMLPSCRQCTKLGEECKFYDPVLMKDTPRQYVCALKENYEILRAVLQKASGSSPGTPIQQEEKTSSLSATSFPVRSDENQANNFLKGGRTLAEAVSKLGSMSVFDQLLRLASKMALMDMPLSVVSPPGLEDFLQSMLAPARPNRGGTGTSPTHHVAEMLVHQYQHSIELLFPILGAAVTKVAVDVAYRKTRADDSATTEMNVTLYLILAITTRTLSKKTRDFKEWSMALFERARSELGTVMSALTYPSVLSVRLNLLVCMYLWLDPAAGNVWRWTGQASRSAMDLRRVLHSQENPSWDEWIIYTTLFRMETDLSVSYGRPPQLIEAEVPANMEIPTDQRVFPHLLYELSRFKYRSHVASLGSELGDLQVQARLQCCKEGIEAWLGKWKQSIHSVYDKGSGNMAARASFISWLEVYGTFYHSEALLRVHMLPAGEQTSAPEAVAVAREVIRSFSKLHLDQTSIVEGELFPSSGQKPTLLLAPLPWSAVHSMCAAGVFLMDVLTSEQDLEVVERLNNDIELCISLLSFLENDSDNAAAGLSNSLKTLRKACGEKRWPQQGHMGPS